MKIHLIMTIDAFSLSIPYWFSASNKTQTLENYQHGLDPYKEDELLVTLGFYVGPMPCLSCLNSIGKEMHR